MPSISELLKQKVVRIALGIVAVIALGSLTYYLIETIPPKISFVAVTRGNVTKDVSGTGVVSPVQNPVLSFQSGGQVQRVNVQTGQKVTAGMVLATLDTGVASANLAAAQAKLDELQAGPRSTDVAGKQTAVQTAQVALTNSYTNYPQTLQSTLAKAQEAVNNTDTFFDRSNVNNPVLLFQTNNQSLKYIVDGERTQLISLFTTWQMQVNAADPKSQSSIQTVTAESQTNLAQVQAYLNDLVAALNDAQIGMTWTQSQDTAALATANGSRDTVNSLISSLTAANQALTTNQLTVTSAQDALDQTLAGSASQEIQAQQATVAALSAQLRQQEIIAPFSGTVASVSIKAGDNVSASTQAIALVPNGNFEVDVYLAENDMIKLKVGDAADITLDAYGSGRVFPASVATIETSPSIDPNSVGGTQGGYKATLVFANADPAIANGMHANTIIHAGNVQNVLIVPKSAVITNNSKQYVLKQTAEGTVQVPVTVGLVGDTSAEVTSGLSEGDRVSAVGAQ